MSLSAIQTATSTDSIIRDVAYLPEDWHLFHGGRISSGQLAYSWYGDPAKPCVLVLGGISAGRDVAQCTTEYAAGWWSCQVGLDSSSDKKSIDTARYSVLGIDYLGGNGQSSAPCHQQDQRCNAIDSRDQARAIAWLAKELGIQQFFAAIGSSYGGMVVLALIEEFRELVDKALVISCSDQASVQSTGIRNVQRQIVELGVKQGNGAAALSIARALAMVTYRSPQELQHRFENQNSISEQGFVAPIVNYLSARGDAFTQHFDPLAFCRLSQSIDLHRIDPSNIKTPLTCIGVEEDQLIPIEHIQRMASLANANFIKINSIYGHDAFLKEKQTIGWLIQKFLSNRTTQTV